MEVEYQLEQSDLVHLNWRKLRTQQGRQLGIVTMIVAGAVFTLALMRGDPFFVAFGAAMAILVFYVLLVFLMLRIMVASIYKTLSRSPSWGKVHVRLEPECLATATHLIKSEIRWEAVTKIFEDQKGFYLQLNPIQTIMVPRRVFASAEEAQMFWTVTQEYYQHARRIAV